MVYHYYWYHCSPSSGSLMWHLSVSFVCNLYRIDSCHSWAMWPSLPIYVVAYEIDSANRNLVNYYYVDAEDHPAMVHYLLASQNLHTKFSIRKLDKLVVSQQIMRSNWLFYEYLPGVGVKCPVELGLVFIIKCDCG